MRRWATLALQSGALLCVLMMAGCTIIGLNLSQDLNEQNKVRRPIRGEDLHDLPLGTEIRVELFRGGQYTGALHGIHAQPDSAYALRYELARAQLNAWLPELGESIRITNGSTQVGTFKSFDYDGVRLLEPESGFGLRDISSIEAVRGGGANVAGDMLRQLSSGGRLPYQSSISMDARGQAAQVSTNDIAGIYELDGAAWVWLPLAMGIVVDVGLFYFASEGVWGE